MTTKGTVKGIVSNLVTVEVDGPVSQNEICYITVGGVPLMSEVIRVNGKNAYAQVFESTRGMRIGDPVTFEGHMLEVTLGECTAAFERLPLIKDVDILRNILYDGVWSKFETGGDKNESV